MGFDASGRMYGTMHGRTSQTNWRASTPSSRARRAPPRSWSALTQGADFGWPECYFDGEQKKLVLAPEYGGDGGKTVGVCAQKQRPRRLLPRPLGAERSPDL